MTSQSSDIMQWVRSAASGDDDAFRKLVGAVYPDLRRWALARTGDFDDADEVVQRALIRMHRGLSGFRAESHLTSWLYRIVANAAIDLQRERAARPGSSRSPDSSATGKVVEAAAATESDPVQRVHVGRMADMVGVFLETLPARQREVLELVDHQGMRAVDVAEMLGIHPGSVRANLFKARRTVRAAILTRYPELTEGYGT